MLSKQGTKITYSIHDIVTRNGLENKYDTYAYINSFPCWSCLRCYQLYIILVMIYYNENGFLRIIINYISLAQLISV